MIVARVRVPVTCRETDTTAMDNDSRNNNDGDGALDERITTMLEAALRWQSGVPFVSTPRFAIVGDRHGAHALTGRSTLTRTTTTSVTTYRRVGSRMHAATAAPTGTIGRRVYVPSLGATGASRHNPRLVPESQRMSVYHETGEADGGVVDDDDQSDTDDTSSSDSDDDSTNGSSDTDSRADSSDSASGSGDDMISDVDHYANDSHGLATTTRSHRSISSRGRHLVFPRIFAAAHGGHLFGRAHRFGVPRMHASVASTTTTSLPRYAAAAAASSSAPTSSSSSESDGEMDNLSDSEGSDDGRREEQSSGPLGADDDITTTTDSSSSSSDGGDSESDTDSGGDDYTGTTATRGRTSRRSARVFDDAVTASINDARASGTALAPSRDTVNALPTRTHCNARDGDGTCAVCLDDFAEGDQLRVLPCTHAYHVACIDRWLASHVACPCCRAPVATRDACVTAPLFLVAYPVDPAPMPSWMCRALEASGSQAT